MVNSYNKVIVNNNKVIKDKNAISYEIKILRDKSK